MFILSSRNYYYYYRRPIGDLMETSRRPIENLTETYRIPNGDLSETHPRPTCLISAPPDTPTCFIRDRHALLEIDMTDRLTTFPLGDPSEPSLPSPIRILKNKYFNIFIFICFLLTYVYWNNIIRCLIIHVGLRPSMSFSDRLSIRHVGFRLGMSVSERSSIKHKEVFDGSPRSGMSVSDGSPIIMIFKKLVDLYFLKLTEKHLSWKLT